MIAPARDTPPASPEVRPPIRIGVDFHVFDGKFQGSRSHLVAT
jgi:hypothetical protein